MKTKIIILLICAGILIGIGGVLEYFVIKKSIAYDKAVREYREKQQNSSITK